VSIASRVARYNRERKLRLFLDTLNPGPETTVLDVGFTDAEYHDTDNYLEKYYPYPQRITALGIDSPKEFPRRYPEVKVVRYDGRIFPFRDEAFDACWSNGVFEHVGGRERQELFLREIKRVSKLAFVTSGYRYFPVELHTGTLLLHWFLPKRLFRAYLRLRRKYWWATDYLYLVRMRDVKAALRGAGISKYRILRHKVAGFTYNLIIIF